MAEYLFTFSSNPANPYINLENVSSIESSGNLNIIIHFPNNDITWRYITNAAREADLLVLKNKQVYCCPSSGGGGTVDSVNTLIGDVVLTTDEIPEGITNLYYTPTRFNTAFSTKTTSDLPEGSNLYFTTARVNSNANVSANTAARHGAVTIGTANGLSLSTQTLSLGLATTSVNGALSAADWNTFSGKQNVLGYTAENVANKAITLIAPNNTTYPTTLAVSSAISAAGGGTVTSISSATADATITSPSTSPVVTIISSPKWSTARNLAGNSVDGSGNVAFSNKFIVQGTSDSGLSGAQFLGGLSTGIVKNTTTTGILSIATSGIDYQSPISLTTSGSGAATFISNVLNIPIPTGTTYTFSTGLTNTSGTITVNNTQSILKLTNLTTNGFVKTSSSDGTLSIDTNTYLINNQSIILSGDVTGSGTTSITANVGKINGVALSGLSTGILKNTTTTGMPSIAVAGDFPILNQNTTGSANILTNPRTIAISGDLSYTSPFFNGSTNVTAVGTLATVNSNIGSFGSASQVGTFTINAKGLTTAASNVSIQIAESQVTNLVTDLAAKQNTITLTTTGSSGPATFISNTLNIPQIVDFAVDGITGADYLGISINVAYPSAPLGFRVICPNAFTPAIYTKITSSTWVQTLISGTI